MFKFLFFIIISTSAAFLLLGYQKKMTPKQTFQEVKSRLGLSAAKEKLLDSDYRKAEPQIGLDYKPQALDPLLPYLRIQYLYHSKTAVVPADQVLTGVEFLDGKPIKMILQNSSGYEIMRMYGSDSPTFESPQLVFDWSKRETNDYVFERGFFTYPYYMVQWKSVLSSSTPKAAYFFIEGSVKTAPVLHLTYQPVNSGTKTSRVKTFDEKNGEDLFLYLRSGSLVGMKLELSGDEIKTCQYQAPNQPKSDCKEWLSQDYVASVSPSDIGRHHIEIQVEGGAFQYQFEVKGIE